MRENVDFRVAALYFNQIKERGCMFEVGDRVFYGVVGVCEVEDIAAPPIKGIDGKYYYLQPVYDDKGIITLLWTVRKCLCGLLSQKRRHRHF